MWAERYVGMAVSDAFDCAELARLVMREQFGREIGLPRERDYAGLDGVAKARAMSEQVSRVQADFVRVLARAPQDGDCVLLTGAGRVTHVGIYCGHQGRSWALHASDRLRQVVLSSFTDLRRLQWTIDGVYEWI